MLALVLGVLAALTFLLSALDTHLGDADLFALGFAFWAGAWTASRRGV